MPADGEAHVMSHSVSLFVYLSFRQVIMLNCYLLKTRYLDSSAFGYLLIKCYNVAEIYWNQWVAKNNGSVSFKTPLPILLEQ